MSKELTEKQKALIKKVQALAERGVGGEKETAEKKLNMLMKKYGIESLELDEDRLDDYDFKFSGSIEKKILRQVIYKVLRDPEKVGKSIFYYRYGAGSKSTLIVNCTKAEEIEIRIQFDFYKDLWKEEQELLLDAFIQHHRLFGTGTADSRDLTPEEIERIQRMFKMEAGLQDKTMTPMLEEKC